MISQCSKNHSLDILDSFKHKVFCSYNFTKHVFCTLYSFLDGDAGSSPKSSERNRLIQMLNNDEVTKSPGYRRVQEAYHLLKTDSTVRV